MSQKQKFPYGQPYFDEDNIKRYKRLQELINARNMINNEMAIDAKASKKIIDKHGNYKQNTKYGGKYYDNNKDILNTLRDMQLHDIDMLHNHYPKLDVNDPKTYNKLIKSRPYYNIPDNELASRAYKPFGTDDDDDTLNYLNQLQKYPDDFDYNNMQEAWNNELLRKTNKRQHREDVKRDSIDLDDDMDKATKDVKDKELQASAAGTNIPKETSDKIETTKIPVDTTKPIKDDVVTATTKPIPKDVSKDVSKDVTTTPSTTTPADETLGDIIIYTDKKASKNVIKGWNDEQINKNLDNLKKYVNDKEAYKSFTEDEKRDLSHLLTYMKHREDKKGKMKTLEGMLAKYNVKTDPKDDTKVEEVTKSDKALANPEGVTIKKEGKKEITLPPGSSYSTQPVQQYKTNQQDISSQQPVLVPQYSSPTNIHNLLSYDYALTSNAEYMRKRIQEANNKMFPRRTPTDVKKMLKLRIDNNKNVALKGGMPISAFF